MESLLTEREHFTVMEYEKLSIVGLNRLICRAIIKLRQDELLCDHYTSYIVKLP
jgi:hypothetical protein